MGVVKVPCLDKLSEPQLSAECNHENPVRGINFTMHYHIENLSGEFHIIILTCTKTHPEGGRAGGKTAKMNAWEDNVSKINCVNIL